MKKVATAGIPALVVVEDEQLLGRLDSWLTTAGYVVQTCSRYEAARKHLAATTPSVIVADVRLGQFNGLQLVLVAKNASPAICGIVLARDDDAVLRREAHNMGASYLVKPITRDELFEVLKTARPAVPARG